MALSKFVTNPTPYHPCRLVNQKKKTLVSTKIAKRRIGKKKSAIRCTKKPGTRTKPRDMIGTKTSLIVSFAF
jgi:hypothetical protein